MHQEPNPAPACGTGPPAPLVLPDVLGWARLLSTRLTSNQTQTTGGIVEKSRSWRTRAANAHRVCWVLDFPDIKVLKERVALVSFGCIRVSLRNAAD